MLSGKRKRGRPLGSKNRSKLPPFVLDETVTEERMTHGDMIVRDPNAFLDDLGEISQPIRNIDILERWFKNNIITSDMRTAGDEFSRYFRLAHFDPLHAASLDAKIDHKITDSLMTGPKYAIDHVIRTMDRLGGRDTSGGSCVWHVLGLGDTLRQWAHYRGWNGRLVQTGEAATMTLITALGAMAADKK